MLSTLDHLWGKSFLIVEYEKIVSKPIRQIELISTFSSLEIQRSELESFKNNYIEKSQEHSRFSHKITRTSDDIPQLCKEIYGYLVSEEVKKQQLNIDQQKELIRRWKNTFSEIVSCNSINRFTEEYISLEVESNKIISEALSQAEHAKAEAKKEKHLRLKMKRVLFGGLAGHYV